MARVVYKPTGMIDPQKQADRIRNLVEEHEAIQRVGLEVLWATGTTEELLLRARHHDRVLTLQRGQDWRAAGSMALARELSNELVTDALGTDRPTVPTPYWRRTTASTSLTP